MPRQARLDIPGALHHVMGRGIQREKIFSGSEDREEFLARLGKVVEKESLLVYAWALMPNHFHLLMRTTKTPLSHVMRKLLSGYAGYFNRRYGRAGHLFQNRFKSVLCEDDPYFLELVRYIHLNPLRAGLVKSLEGLGGSSLTGHSVLVGKVNRPWQCTGEVLARFSGLTGQARSGYIRFVEEGLKRPAPKHLEGGGLVRSQGGWSNLIALRRGRESFLADERILGGSGFVEGLLKEAEREAQVRGNLLRRWDVKKLIKAVCENVGVDEGQLVGGGKVPPVPRAREGISYLWVKKMGRSGGELSRSTGMKPVTVYESAVRGEKNAKTWDEILHTLKI
ncbi:MAG: transposase [Elusimicrobia bacterium]|nr:transposase [Elusimicrobiota bacterium]